MERIQKQNEFLYDQNLLSIQKQQVKYYQSALNKIQDKMESLYEQIERTEPGKRIVDLYQYDKFYRMRSAVSKELMGLGVAISDLDNRKFLSMYNQVQKSITLFAPGSISSSFVVEGRANEVINTIWCQDGKHWSNRIWSNMAELQNQLEKGLIDCIVGGQSKDELIRQLRQKFGVSYLEADRLARTELSYIQNQSARDRYVASGITEYQWLSTHDGRCCDECQELDGKVFSFDQAVIGENFPPKHPNDRCAILPVIREGETNVQD